MGQFGFFDADRRLAAITAKGDPLEMIARVVPFESFRAEIEAAVLTPVSEKRSSAGRKPIDVMVMFRMLVPQSFYYVLLCECASCGSKRTSSEKQRLSRSRKMS